MRHIFLLLTALSLVACSAEIPIEPTGDVNTAISESNKPERTEEDLLLALKEIEFDFNGFNPTDSTTWGDVAETDSKGRPTKYVKTSPDGSGQILTFHHGSPNTKFEASDGIIGSNYIHWHRPNKAVPILIADETNERWNPLVQKYARIWNLSPEINLVVRLVKRPFLFDNTFSIKKCIGHTPGVIVICDYDFSENSNVDNVLGGYTWEEFGRDGHIKSAVIHLNNEDRRFDDDDPRTSKDSEDGLRRADANRNVVVCHEMGHAIGLEHFDYRDNQIVKGTCMDYSDNPWKSLKPDINDYKTLSITYGHSHDLGNSLGVVCTSESTSRIQTSYIQRIKFNGADAIASMDKKIQKNKDHLQLGHEVFIVMEDGRNAIYSWSSPNFNDMKEHRRGKTGAFPSLVSHKITAHSMAQIDGVYKVLEEKIKNGVHQKGCRDLTEQERGDVSRFSPPKNGQRTGSYKRDQISTTPDGDYISEDGSFVIKDDYERIYEYVEYPGLPANLIDPVINPVVTHEPAAP